MSRALMQLLRTDLLRSARDPMIVLLGVLPVLLTLASVYALPRLAAMPALAGHTGTVRLVTVASLLLITPLMFGLVTGLMLLDERDEGVLTAVALTPTGRSGFVAYRLALPVVWSCATGLLVLWLPGRGLVGVSLALLLALLAGLQAPLITLFLGAFAPSKVEGLALGKVANVLVALGALAVLLPAPWQWAAAPSPHFWLVRLLVSPPVGASGAAAVGLALAVHAGALIALERRFRGG